MRGLSTEPSGNLTVAVNGSKRLVAKSRFKLLSLSVKVLPKGHPNMIALPVERFRLRFGDEDCQIIGFYGNLFAAIGKDGKPLSPWAIGPSTGIHPDFNKGFQDLLCVVPSAAEIAQLTLATYSQVRSLQNLPRLVAASHLQDSTPAQPKDETRHGAREPLAGTVVPQEPGQRTRASRVTANKMWRCPKCGKILEKGHLGTTWHPGDPISLVGGTATCGACFSKYDQADVYGGKYDVEENPTKLENTVSLQGKVSVVLFRSFSTAAPADPRVICSSILTACHPNAALDKCYVIGVTNSVTIDSASVRYRANLEEGKLPDLGTQSDAWSGEDPTGKEVVGLFFKGGV